jgi:hypothetical protein
VFAVAASGSIRAHTDALAPSRRMRVVSAALAGLGVVVTASCAHQPEQEAPLAVNLALASSQGPGLPADVAFLRVLFRVGDREPQLRVAEVQQLATEDGRRRLVLDDLPAGTPLSVRVEGQVASGEIAYLGSLGPLTLAGGEDLKAQVFLASANESTPLSNAPPARFLHTATALADGRVLVTGGFGAPTSAPCPSGAAADARCFRVVALKDAWLFDTSTLSFHEVSHGSLEARAGHTSTRLPDGRVLIAGGAREALLLFDAETPALPRFIPLDAADLASASASFELFAPDLGGSGPRDPARGRFVGSAAAPAMPGPLLGARFLHAAASNLSVAGQVLLVGGLGSSASATSYEIFDADRAGGYGTSASLSGNLTVERTLPSAVAARAGADSAAVWIFGGNRARSNDGLAELWSHVVSAPQGSVRPATKTLFPAAAPAASGAPRPEYAFLSALVASLGDHTHALVTGSLPPFCGDSATPAFASTSLAELAGSCGAPADLRRCFVVDAESGATEPCTTLQGHLGGAASELGDGSALFSGGLDDLTGEMSLSLERFTLTSTAPASLTTLATLALATPRAYHTSTPLPEGGALSVGGLNFETGVPVLSESAEVVRW